MVKFLSKSDNFSAKFLNYLKGPPHDFFQNSEIEFLQDVKVLAQYNFRGASKLGLGQLLGQLCLVYKNCVKSTQNQVLHLISRKTLPILIHSAEISKIYYSTFLQKLVHKELISQYY